jgi:hypothetical protein
LKMITMMPMIMMIILDQGPVAGFVKLVRLAGILV